MAIINLKITIHLVLLLISVLTIVVTMKIVPERCDIDYVNNKYAKYGNCSIRRYSRRGAYYGNFEGQNYHTWTNNITLNIVFYEYLHNEYRRSFVQLSVKFCDIVNSEPYIGGMLRRHNVTCPLHPGDYHLMNLTLPMETFRHVWPFEKARIDTEITVTDTKEVIGSGHLYAKFVPDYNLKKRKN